MAATVLRRTLHTVILAELGLQPCCAVLSTVRNAVVKLIQGCIKKKNVSIHKSKNEEHSNNYKFQLELQTSKPVTKQMLRLKLNDIFSIWK